ncbi:hypothetical protein GCM10023094_22770 [Rhodococcus olei]|uniref:DNA-binding IclR family transcriptional regulator n=1 Tax=Rhodococcus olei TaxID=2161675 RepID=A0ABP8P327_9NOCA
MAPGKSESSVSSPPTDRVVSIVELLAARDTPATSADLADALGLSRSTTGSILGTLQRRGWVSRLPDLRYEIGPALASIAGRAHRALTLPDDAAAHLEALAARVGCGAALGLIDGGEMVFVAMTDGLGHIPAGIDVGVRLPLQAPGGASVVAFSDPPVQQRWLGTAPADRREQYADFLTQVSETGVAVWGADAADIDRIDVLAQVVTHLAANAASQRLREQVQALIGDTSGYPYTQEALESDRSLPISYLTAPVFDDTGRPLWELHIGPLRSAVTPDERRAYVDELTATARAMSLSPR